MPLIQQALRFLPELRASLFHFTVFLSSGVTAVYFGIWLADKGIAADQIGIINAVPGLIMLAVNLFIGRIADKASDWRTMIIILALIAGVAPIGMYFVNEFWGVLLIWTLIVLPAGSIPPVIDAATIRLTQRNGTDFGFVRAWGTVGYMVSTAASGAIIAYYGADAFVPLFVILSLARAALALQLPRFRAPAHETTLAKVTAQAGRLREVLKPWFVLPLIAYGLINVNHGVIVVFNALVWKEAGVSEGMIGPLFAFGAVAEAAMMFAWKRLGWTISARQMLLVAGVFTVIRWVGFALNPPVPVLFVLMGMHAFTYAIGYFGMVHFIANWTSEEIAAETQGFAFVLQQSLSVAGLLIFGWLIGLIGAKAFFFAALLGVVAIICVMISLRLRPPHEMALQSGNATT
jgi:PPP family 3-phenylpropionic acid transporter